MYRTDGTSSASERNNIPNKHASITEKYRRNGKLQSCEPCRRSKLRCDHVVPACGRCVKRGKVGHCFYHPNPLTRKRVASPHHPPPPPAPSVEAVVDASPCSEPVVHSVELYDDALITPTSKSNHSTVSPQSHSLAFSPAGLNVDSSHAHCQPFHRAASAPPLDYQTPHNARRNTGFQGPTSNLSILKETLRAVDAEPAGLDSLDQHDNIVVTNVRITQGCKLLATFQNRSIISHFVQRYYDISNGGVATVMPLMMSEWLGQLWALHGTILASQEPAAIRRLSERIWRNTLTTLSYDGDTTALAYAQSSSGLHLRWEAVGLICSTLAFAVLETPPTDHIFVEHQVTRSCLIDRMKETMEKCLEFCRYCEVLDDLFVWLLLDYATIIQATKGDRHYATYRATGEAHSAVIAMGLHQEIRVTRKVPFWLAELRKRTFILAYFCEISLATCLGRPPRLSYRYCNVEAPLDLTDAEIVQTGADLEATLASLDENGYNTAGLVREVTCVRAHAHYMQRREDVVDLALGQYTRDEVLALAACIKRKNDQHMATLPLCIRQLTSQALNFTPTATSVATAASTSTKSGTSAPIILNPTHAVWRGTVRMGQLSNEILLQRVLIRRTGASSEKLIQAARAVLSDVMQLTGRQDVAVRFQASYNLYLGGHGLRSAAIVAVELLKQEIAAETAAAAAATNPSEQQQQQSLYDHYPENAPLPRSQTIQDLAVFASRLAAVDASDGTYPLCEQGHRVITKILDRILEPKKKIRQRVPSASLNAGGSGQLAAEVNMALAQTQPPIQTQTQNGAVRPYSSSNGSGSRQAQTFMAGQAGQQQQSQMQSNLAPSQTLAPAQMNNFGTGNSTAASDNFLGYGMMDIGMGVEAPLSLGQDTDFMAWLQEMDLGRVDNWTM
ncbi:hypothetical protein BD289DRAFT_449101 [Coniella lustricola]|uniref:Zn(2)-C6 fungal-type domain-containing protein n=1 Tax=Coniella lustricola TaxID=2025994 RepID=A0A2T3ANK2_9PEZI|nr:hypothetical protein BD289DRAFT_449101 [Coniella lustricola]